MPGCQGWTSFGTPGFMRNCRLGWLETSQPSSNTHLRTRTPGRQEGREAPEDLAESSLPCLEEDEWAVAACHTSGFCCARESSSSANTGPHPAVCRGQAAAVRRGRIQQNRMPPIVGNYDIRCLEQYPWWQRGSATRFQPGRACNNGTIEWLMKSDVRGCKNLV